MTRIEIMDSLVEQFKAAGFHSLVIDADCMIGNADGSVSDGELRFTAHTAETETVTTPSIHMNLAPFEMGISDPDTLNTILAQRVKMALNAVAERHDHEAKAAAFLAKTEAEQAQAVADLEAQKAAEKAREQEIADLMLRLQMLQQQP